MKMILLIALSLTSFCAEAASRPQVYWSQQLTKQADFDLDTISSFAEADITSGNPWAAENGHFEQKINHQDAADTRVFSQRYFKNSNSAGFNPNAPVLLVICGEAACSSNDLEGAVGHYAKALGAHRIALEHRYYGRSQPFGDLSTENLRYLTTENALQDLAAFERWAKARFNLHGPWIVIGGSYSGSLAAYYRVRFPDLVVGALASSAPVEAREDFHEYDAHVAAAAGPACATKIREIVAALEASLDNPEQLAQYKTIYNATIITNPLDFLGYVADIAAIAIQYGKRQELCDSILQATNLDEAIANYGTIGNYLFASMGLDASVNTAAGSQSIEIAKYSTGLGMRQWLYQSCSEYGYWQAANTDSEDLRGRSARLVVAYYQNFCSEVFGISFENHAQTLNQSYYEVLRQAHGPSNILFLNGSNDPWSRLSITKERNNNQNASLTLYTIANSAHCDDLRDPVPWDSRALQNARSLTMASFRSWIAAPGY